MARLAHPSHGCILTLTPEERSTVRRALVLRGLVLKEGGEAEDSAVSAELARIEALLERLD
jgi:hypothetical protein